MPIRVSEGRRAISEEARPKCARRSISFMSAYDNASTDSFYLRHLRYPRFYFSGISLLCRYTHTHTHTPFGEQTVLPFLLSSAPSRLGVNFIFHPEEQSHIAHADSRKRRPPSDQRGSKAECARRSISFMSAYSNPCTGSVQIRDNPFSPFHPCSTSTHDHCVNGLTQNSPCQTLPARVSVRSSLMFAAVFSVVHFMHPTNQDFIVGLQKE